MDFAGNHSLFFAFRRLDVEIWARHEASSAPAKGQVSLLWDRMVQVGLPGEKITRLQGLWDALERADFDSIYPNYLLHPLRIAHSLTLFPETASADLVSVALCHNFREVADAPVPKSTLDAIEAEFLDAPARRSLDLLFTNRSRERDEIYMASYFKDIADAGAPLVILKGFDKLDNHLTYAFENLDPFHHQTVKRFMIPALEIASPRLAAYLERLVSHVGNPDAVKSYQEAAKVRGH